MLQSPPRAVSGVTNIFRLDAAARVLTDGTLPRATFPVLWFFRYDRIDARETLICLGG